VNKGVENRGNRSTSNEAESGMFFALQEQHWKAL